MCTCQDYMALVYSIQVDRGLSLVSSRSLTLYFSADILALFHAQFYENAPLIPKGRRRPLASEQLCIPVSVDIFKQISVLFPRSEENSRSFNAYSRCYMNSSRSCTPHRPDPPPRQSPSAHRLEFLRFRERPHGWQTAR